MDKYPYIKMCLMHDNLSIKVIKEINSGVEYLCANLVNELIDRKPLFCMG